METSVKYSDYEVTGTYAGLDFQPVFEDEVMAENLLLKNKLKTLERKVSTLEKRMPEEKVLILRDIPKEQAVKEIKEIFESGRTLYYSDIADELSLDLEMVVNVCNGLLESGDLHVDDRATK